MFGIIGGTGLYEIGAAGERQIVATKYGEIQVERLRIEEQEVVFLPRHSFDHSIPPHRVNYRGNIAALRELGVNCVLASAAVGSMNESLPPGALSLLTQFIDFTHARPTTFFDGEGGKVFHVDVTEPYCPYLCRELISAAQMSGETLSQEAVYVCTEGPRFETPAEIRMFQQFGGDLVGMTNYPEVVLAREAGMCYAAVAIVTNWAAGVTAEPIEHGQVTAFMESNVARVQRLFKQTVTHHHEIECECRRWATG
jgi:5'-methylthioadenosine phosphorylase